jgi:DNA-binding transcriptional regulator LsrR (DeoR family)
LPDDLSADDHELLARIAHRSYVDGRTQEEIATEFGRSRPKIQRLLERARTTGVVEIHIASPAGLHLDLESRLINGFGLADAIVSPDRADPQDQRSGVARSAARYLERRLQDGAVVAVSHGRTAGEVPRFFRPDHRIDCVFASAMGGSTLVDAPTNPNEIARSLAQGCGGRAESLYAPVYVDDAATRDLLLAQESVARSLAIAVGATVALVGIGGTDDACTMVRSGCLGPDEIGILRDRGAAGDILGSYVDVDGQLIKGSHSDRLIALSIEDLSRIDTVIAVVSESDKTLAILGALRSGVINVLIVDEGNARAVLELAGPQGGT